MPKVTLTPGSKVQTGNVQYPKLTLDHGERALILCIEPEPTVEYAHTLRMPLLDPSGKVVKETKKNNTTGEEYEQTATEFVGMHLCFGDFETVDEKGVDPEGCPTCRAAVEEDGISAPAPRYAMHIIRYSLTPGGWTLRDPFNVDCLAWVFSPTRLNQIIDVAAEFPLLDHDLKLGPCENKGYQKYDIQPSAKAEWRKNKERQEVVAQTYKNNKTDDLSLLIARRVDKTKALEDIQTVLERYAQAYGRGSAPAVPEITQSSTPTLSKSEDNPFKEDAGSEAPKQEARSFDDILADL